jgi:hypothetical protein
MKRLTLLFVMFASVAFGQSDTTQLNTVINSNFPNNTSNFITPTRLRTVAKELMRSSANLLEPNTFAERQTFEDAVIGEDSIKSDVGFYVWNGVAYEEIGGADQVLWEEVGDTLKPVTPPDKYFVQITDGDTTSTFYSGKFLGKLLTSFSLSSPQGVSSISAGSGRLSLTAPVATINATDYARIAADSIVLDGNAHVVDTLFASVIDKSYGEMGFRDSSYTVALTIDVPAWATNAGNNLWAQSAVTMKSVTYAGDSLVIGRSGVYYLSGHISVAGSNNDVLRAYIYKNGSPLCLCSPVISLTNNRIVNLQLNTDIAPLASGDVLKVYIENIGTNNDVAVISGKLTVHRIN